MPKISKGLIKEMGIIIVNGQYVDKYDRILEEYYNSKDGYQDLKPTGRIFRDTNKLREFRTNQ